MPSRTVFLDTNGWLALLNSSDSLHAVASTAWNTIGNEGGSIVVTDWVVAETGNGLARTSARATFVLATQVLLSSSRANVIYVEKDLLALALALYKQRGDKTWGLIDCASFMVMQELGITDALTNDRHFVQAGFRCLL